MDRLRHRPRLARGRTRSMSGYNVFAPWRERGYATRAVRLLLGLLRDHSDHQRTNLVVDVDNIASLGVARVVSAKVVPSNFDDDGRASR